MGKRKQKGETARIPVKSGENPGSNRWSGKGIWRRYGLPVLTLNDDPHFIAKGIAIGVFVGCTPTMPFHTILAVGLAFIFHGSKAAAALGVWICNPLTFPFLYLGSFRIGHRLINTPLSFNHRLDFLPDILQNGIDTTLVMVAGGVLIGILPAMSSYFLSRYAFAAIRNRKTAFSEISGTADK